MKLVYRNTPTVAEKFLTMAYNAIRIAGPANPELTSKGSGTAVK